MSVPRGRSFRQQYKLKGVKNAETVRVGIAHGFDIGGELDSADFAEVFHRPRE
ncbi:MAG: hypothetical protein GY903_28975 [Fuerstiella sp.]|nr:hypothetical protein [Fuerstiella sp.]MCP4858529.1 hypothetical protein [Fuerstiella sp.]